MRRRGQGWQQERDPPYIPVRPRRCVTVRASYAIGDNHVARSRATVWPARGNIRFGAATPLAPERANEKPRLASCQAGLSECVPEKSVSGILREIRCYVELLLGDRKQHLMRLGL